MNLRRVAIPGALLVALICVLPLAAQNTSAPLPIDAQTMQKLRMHSVPPVYPPAEKMHGRSGDVLLKVVLGTDGSVLSAMPVTSTSDAFAAAAVASVEQWKYKAYLLNGQAVSVEGDVEIHFRMAN